MPQKGSVLLIEPFFVSLTRTSSYHCDIVGGCPKKGWNKKIDVELKKVNEYILSSCKLA
jgi:hypothetical protein